MDYFMRCQAIVFEREGADNFDIIDGKAVLKPKNRNDSGGPTRYGITQGTLQRAYSQGITTHNDIIKLTKSEALDIYEANYWVPCKANKMPWGLCLVHYDCAVNCGISGAAKQLQRALNDLGKPVVIDGVIGPASLQAIAELDISKLIDAYLSARKSFYNALVAKKPSQGDFLNGWMKRLEDIRKEAHRP